MSASGFMHRYYDWAAFEAFVKELYEGDGDITIERNVLESDKYGAPRETDIKITRRTRFEKFVTLVECKRWKDPVSRDRVDVLAASVEALGANSGVLFTTTGFEDGAIAYAQGRGIKAFVVRDLTPEEWGLPGRHVSFILHIVRGEFRDVGTPNAQAIVLVDQLPTSLALNIQLDQKMAMDPEMDLFSIKNGARGPNLVSILGDVHGLVLRALVTAIPLMDGGRDTLLELVAACELDLSRTEYCQLRLPAAAVRLNTLSFKLASQVAQSTFSFDRGASLDFAVMIESYVSEQRLLAHRARGDQQTTFEVANYEGQKTHNADDILQNGSIFRVVCAPWVGLAQEQPTRSAVVDKLIRASVEIVDGKPKISLQGARS